MKTVRVMTLMLVASLLIASVSFAQNWQTVYETDFSSDPGWTTNSTSHFYWDATSETYYADQENVNYGGYYTYHDAGYDGGSFLLEWDIIMEYEQYASDLGFGLFDGDLDTKSESYVRLSFTHEDRGLMTYLKWNSLGGSGYEYCISPQWALNTWYHVVMEYNANANTNTLDVDVYDRDTGSHLFSLNATNVGPFDMDMGLVGSSNYRVSGTFQNPGGHMQGRFDNVSYSLAGQCSPLYTFTGEALDDVFGMSVSGAGDVNNDGFDDIISGACGSDAAGLSAGRAYVYSGMDGSLLYMFTGASDHDFFGTAVSGAGDVNNDGYDDLLIGASQAAGTSSWGAGIAYIYSGLDGSLLYTFIGEAEDDRFGMYHISGAGDVNNDGFADVIVGASYNDALGNRTGKAYVFHGSGGPFPITVLATDADRTFTGTVIDGGLGFAVAGAGDVNNDNYDDLLVGAWTSTRIATVYVYSGWDGSILYNLVAETSGDGFGYSVSAGDLNSDGIVDFVVGAPRNHTAGQYAGRAYAFYGRSESFPITINASDADIIFTGEYVGDYFGIDVSIAGDVNHDSYEDIVIGSDGFDDPYDWSGRAYVYSGIDGTLLYILRSEGESEYDEFGLSVSAAGDVNNDGSPDIVIGARQENSSGNGKAYVYICEGGTPEASTLSFPSVAVAPCDSCEYVGDGPYTRCVVQPVVCNLNQEAKAATIPVKIPDGVEICGISYDGLDTDVWDYKGEDIKADSGFLIVYLANSSGLTIPEGPSTLFNIQFRTERLCNESKFIQWDTALSAEPSRRLEFTDLDYQGFVPLFDYELDATEILGYMPGDLNDDGDVTIGDIAILIDHLFITGVRLCNYAAADVNGLGNCERTISDVSILIDHLFIIGPSLELHCGCVSTSPPLAAKGNADVSILSEYLDGHTTITVSSAVTLRGLQLQVQGSGTSNPTNLTDSRLDLFHGATDDVIRIGMIDMDGVESISVGNTPVIRLEGEYEIISALVTDQNHKDIVPVINGARKNEALPMVYALAQNYPNPFNPVTEISYSIKQAGDVRIDVFNMLGQRVATLFEGYSEAGNHSVNWDASDQASGVYLYRLTAGEFVDTKKMMLLK